MPTRLPLLYYLLKSSNTLVGNVFVISDTLSTCHPTISDKELRSLDGLLSPPYGGLNYPLRKTRCFHCHVHSYGPNQTTAIRRIILWRKKSIQKNGLKLVCQNQVICQPSSEPPPTHSRHFPKQVIHHSLGEHWPCIVQWFDRPDTYFKNVGIKCPFPPQ